MPLSPSNVTILSQEDLKTLAYIRQNNCYTTTEILTTRKNSNQDPKSCHYLNGAPTPYFSLLAMARDVGTMYYFSTRNNNFSNRSQKGILVVMAEALPKSYLAVVVTSSVVGVGVMTAGMLLMRNQKFKYMLLGGRNKKQSADNLALA
jgi:hypothetical protein